MAKVNFPQSYRQVSIEAEVQDVIRTDSYGKDEQTIAEVKTTVRLQGRFDRKEVTALVTSIVNQLVDAFDEGEGPQAADPQPLRPEAGLETEMLVTDS